ncbi:hypothetical protein VOLCADRAFT_89645 [Volvox carteri f. nagariensis]|uniref:Uncharacterized protein n=1 Tax=Volvox carteri f. nagariensis TaxID=3068 RepID=D8TSE2_VOLCA|nr:uncharacterized protein VOLCADRAFT_89645 [Volvox carteri f. nagariensis]EFJ49681.1 hypothetical protein VOLCADRAFT_89645 [Volvox carteri f. nagariensis]|eukprot:XP_002949188.1 hypothetical protein VOLCADRAFT_89645 [Volvox carteri f. nagariensis]
MEMLAKSRTATHCRPLPGSCRAIVRSRNLSKSAVADQESLTATPKLGLRVRKALKEWAPTIEALGHGEQTVLFRKGGIKEPTFRPVTSTSPFLLFPTSFHTDQQLLKPGVAERYGEAMRLEPKSESVLRLPYVAQVTGAWTTYDSQVLPVLDDFHVWTEQFIETRLKWRANQPITVMELRCWRLAQPLELPVTESLFGCFSWEASDNPGLRAKAAPCPCTFFTRASACIPLPNTIAPFDCRIRKSAVDVAAHLRQESDLDLELGPGVPVVSDEEFAARQQLLRTALGRIRVDLLELN